jgi:hypothetical protein
MKVIRQLFRKRKGISKRVTRKGNGGTYIGSKYIIYMYENVIMKSII